MRFGEMTALFIRSPLGIASCALSAAVGCAIAFSGFPPVAAIAASSGAMLGGFALATITGLAPKAAARERDRLEARAAEGDAREVARLRARLAGVRISDREVADSVAYAVVEAGEYLAALARGGTRDPRVAFSLGECVELTDAYLAEIDDASKERRFGVPDRDGADRPGQRVAAEIKARAASIKEARMNSCGASRPDDQIAVKEELR